MSSESKKYFAFISYQRKDEKWAKWLQNKLEHYRFPTNLNGHSDLPKRIIPIFRDVTDSAPGVLEEVISGALRNSIWLIVVCSPRSAQSIWVGKEAQSFIDMGRSDHIIPFIIDGKPFSDDPQTECFPDSLLNLTGSRELLGANIHEMGREAAAIKVVARMFGLDFDALWQRRNREKKRNRVISTILLVLLLLIGFRVVSYVSTQKQKADSERKNRLIQTQYNDYLKCEKLFTEHKYAASFRESQKSLKSNPTLPDTLFSNFEYLLRMSYDALRSDTLETANRLKAKISNVFFGNMPVEFSDQGDTIYIGEQSFSVLDANTGNTIITSDDYEVDAFRLMDDRIISFSQLSVDIIDKRTLRRLSSYTTEGKKWEDIAGSSADGRRFLTYDSHGNYYVYDSFSGELIHSFEGGYYTGSLNCDGSVVALTDSLELSVFQVDTGEPAFVEKTQHLSASDLQYDQSGRWLLLYQKEYGIVDVVNQDLELRCSIDIPHDDWEYSFIFSEVNDANKYFVSDDNNYIAIGPNIYSMVDGALFKRLCDPETAVGLKILPGAQKVIQVNSTGEIIIYSRGGEPLFELIDDDIDKKSEFYMSSEHFQYDVNSEGNLTVKTNSGRVLGIIKGIEGNVIELELSVSSDEKLIVVSIPGFPINLYSLSTGQVIQSFNFQPIEHFSKIGFWGDDSELYFTDYWTESTYKYHFIPLEELLEITL